MANQCREYKWNNYNTATPGGPPNERFNADLITIHRLDILPKLAIDAKDILRRFMMEFKLPKDTKIEIENKSKDVVEQSILTLNNPLFTVRILLSSNMWAAGLPGVIRNFILQDQIKIQDDFATCMFTMKFEVTLGYILSKRITAVLLT